MGVSFGPSQAIRFRAMSPGLGLAFGEILASIMYNVLDAVYGIYDVYRVSQN